MFQIHAVNAFTDNYIWLIQSAQDQKVLIIDPGDADPVIRFVEQNGLHPVAILVTHHHHDHVGGIQRLKDLYDLTVFGPQRETIKTLDISLAAQTTKIIDAAFPALQILDTPGHTPGHISYLLENNLFCGDTLFAGGCGRLLGGTAEQLFNSLQTLKQLADDTNVFCAHEYTLANLQFAIAVEPDNPHLLERIATVRELRKQNIATVPAKLHEEKRTNPFLRCEISEVKKAAQTHAGQALNSPLAVFKVLRAWKDSF